MSLVTICRMSPCRMSLSPKKGHVAVSILGVPTHVLNYYYYSEGVLHCRW